MAQQEQNASGCLLMAGLVIAVAYFPVIYFGLSLQSGGPPRVQPIPFESSAWKRADPIEGYRTVRSQMVEDLLHRRLLDGLSRSDVEHLLGPAIEDLSGFKGQFRHYHLAYRLGLQRIGGALAFDDEFLAIRLDEQGRVVEYAPVTN